MKSASTYWQANTCVFAPDGVKKIFSTSGLFCPVRKLQAPARVSEKRILRPRDFFRFSLCLCLQFFAVLIEQRPDGGQPDFDRLSFMTDDTRRDRFTDGFALLFAEGNTHGLGFDSFATSSTRFQRRAGCRQHGEAARYSGRLEHGISQLHLSHCSGGIFFECFF